MNFSIHIDNLNVTLEANDFPTLTSGPWEHKFLRLYVYYYYLNANNAKLLELQNGIFVNTQPPGNRVDALFYDEESQSASNQILDVLYSQYFQNPSDIHQPRTQNQIEHDLNTIKSTLDGVLSRNFKNFYSLMNQYNKLVLDGKPKFRIKMIMNISLDSSFRKELLKKLKNKFGRNYEVEIVTGEEVLSIIEDFTDPVNFVKNGELEIDKPNNALHYVNSLICSISAKSLKKMYEQYSKTGLFSQNLRYYIKVGKIDDQITKSITNSNEDFWYKNNGIIIVCDNYLLKNHTIDLFNFSIVNGGQTTKLVGDSNFDKDFYIACKIIKNPYQDDDLKKQEFALEIAEATNSQKPIKPRDLIANKEEQKSLKRRLQQEENIFYQTKRGDRYNKTIFKEPWQFIQNDEFTQVLASFVKQDPALAKNKTKLLTQETIYQSIFEESFEYDAKFVKDLIWVNLFFSKYQEEVEKDLINGKRDELKISLINYTTFMFLALLGLHIKFRYNPELIKKLLSPSNELSMARLDFYFSQNDLNSEFLINSYENLNKNFNQLFELFYSDFILVSYNDFVQSTGNYDVSVFAKNSSVYKDLLLTKLPEILNHKKINETLDSLIMSPNEKAKKFVQTHFLAEYQPTLEEALKEYRSMKARKTGLSESKIFTNKALVYLVMEKPNTLYQLNLSNLFSNNQVTGFGPDIISIIQKY